MRDYLFRGKVTDDYYIKEMRGTWVEGNLVHQTEYYGMSVDKYHILYTGEFHVDYYDAATVIPETVGQFTGVLDMNGKKVFEGDIVKLTDDVKKTFDVIDGPVYFNHSAFFIKGNDGSLLASLFALVDYTYTLRGEVIGNIYDNPELLGD